MDEEALAYFKVLFDLYFKFKSYKRSEAMADGMSAGMQGLMAGMLRDMNPSSTGIEVAEAMEKRAVAVAKGPEKAVKQRNSDSTQTRPKHDVFATEEQKDTLKAKGLWGEFVRSEDAHRKEMLDELDGNGSGE